MDSKEVNNALIAEFMGLRFHKIGWVDVCHIDGNYECEKLKYHTSWDWLIPVVEKIEQQGCIIEIWLSLGKGCRIQKPITQGESYQAVMESNSTIEAVWLTVIEYITWYNSTKQQTNR